MIPDRFVSPGLTVYTPSDSVVSGRPLGPGLRFDVLPGDGNLSGVTQSAVVRVVLGLRGASVTRLYTVFPWGLWLDVAGYETVRIDLVSTSGQSSPPSATGRGAPALVIRWTATGPPEFVPGYLVQTVGAAGNVLVPTGATHVTGNAADAGAAFRVDPDNTGDRVIPAAIVAGVERAVLGDRLTLTAGNVLWWRITT